MRQGLDVGRREAQLPAALRAAHHDALDPVRAAEDLGGPGDIALGDQPAGERGGERLPAARLTGDVQVDDLDGVVVGGAQLGQERDVPRCLVAEAEVGALDDGLGVQPVDEDLRDEVGGRQLGELGGERQDQQGVHAQLRHQFGAAVVRGQQRRVAAGSDDLAGVRVEGDDDGRNAQLTGALDGPADDQLVSAVHAVVGADGDDAAPPVLGDVLQATPALHCDRSSPEPVYVCMSITQV